jgi:hypothetical protein
LPFSTPGADAPVVQPLLEAFARDDVDGAGDGARAGFGGGRAQHFDAIDLLGRQAVQAEARRQALAVDQQLREAAAQPAHARRTAAAGCAGRGDAGQAAQHLAHGGVAEFFDLVAADHDLGGGGLAAQIGVGFAAADDFHLLACRGRWCGAWRRSRAAGARRGRCRRRGL